MAKLTIQERLELPSSKLGVFLKTTLTYIFMIAAAASEIASISNLLSEDWVPAWLRLTFVICGIIARVSGTLTVHPVVKQEVLKFKEDADPESDGENQV
jgi:hypothetical protein